MTPEELIEALRASEEPKGYYLHADAGHCLETAESLLASQERHGQIMSASLALSSHGRRQGQHIYPCRS